MSFRLSCCCHWVAHIYSLIEFCSIFGRFKMSLLHAEQIGSGRWFNACFWHPAIPLLHWISNISIVRVPIVLSLLVGSGTHEKFFQFLASFCMCARQNQEQIVIIVCWMVYNGEYCVAALWLFNCNKSLNVP